MRRNQRQQTAVLRQAQPMAPQVVARWGSVAEVQATVAMLGVLEAALEGQAA